MNILNLVIDRLHIGYLGCYGNSWIATPNFDRLASDGFVFDQALIESPDLANQYAAMTLQSQFVRGLQEAGIMTALITDDPAVADMPWAADIEEVVRVDVQHGSTSADEIEQTSLARLFAVAGQWLEASRDPFCLWLHCGSLGHVWDAPVQLRERYVDEDESSPPATTAVPSRRLPEGFDPDELLAVTLAYAGQISLLDVCLGVLREDLEQLSLANRTMVSVLSARGFPLGEHHRLGPIDDALYAELVHVPWIMQLPDGCGAADRTPALVQPSDLGPTLLDALGLPCNEDVRTGTSLLGIVRGENYSVRDRAFLRGVGAERALCTDVWHMRVADYAVPASRTGGDLAVELYAKPDDRWEVNDVADRCPEVVELLTKVLDEGLDLTSGSIRAPLADVLSVRSE